MAWFPFLFYLTVYVGDLYKLSNPLPDNDDPTTAASAEEERDKEATIVGTRAFFYFGVLSLVANCLLPFFTTKDKSTAASPEDNSDNGSMTLMDRLRVFHICDLWAFGHFTFALCLGATL